MSRSNGDQWVIHFRHNPQACLRLFCLPFAGGSASIFRTWPACVPADVEICAIQLPGRESQLSQLPLTQVALLIPLLAQAILSYCTMPFAIFGHSLGSLVGFELARHLRRERRPGPLQLFVSAQIAPQLANPNPPIHQLPDPEFLQELRRYNGTPEDVLRHAELMQLLLPMLRADFAMHETYTYAAEEPLDCPITAFGGMQDSHVNRDQLAAWQIQTRQPFTLRMLPGDHFFIHSAHTLLLQALTEELTQLLAQHDH